MFHWTRRMPYWRTWSFLANQNFLRKTIKRYKVVPSSKERFTKNFLWSRGLCFWHPCRKFLPQIWNFIIQNQKRISNIFIVLEKKPFSLKSFLCRTYGMRCWQLHSKFFDKKPALLRSLPISQKCIVSAKFFPQSVALQRTRRMPSWFVQFFFWSCCGRISCGLDTAGGSGF